MTPIVPSTILDDPWYPALWGNWLSTIAEESHEARGHFLIEEREPDIPGNEDAVTIETLKIRHPTAYEIYLCTKDVAYLMILQEIFPSRDEVSLSLLLKDGVGRYNILHPDKQVLGK